MEQPVKNGASITQPQAKAQEVSIMCEGKELVRTEGLYACGEGMSSRHERRAEFMDSQ